MADWDQFAAHYDHPTFEGRPKVYLIASTPRSGSHYLGHLLQASGQCGTPLEYLNPVHQRAWEQKLDASGPEDVFRRLFRRRTSASGWFGIKAHWWQFDRYAANAGLQELLDIREYVRTLRHDRIGQAISLAIARQTNRWISFSSEDVAPVYRLEAVTAARDHLDREYAGWDEYFDRIGLRPLSVAYDDLVANPAGAVERVYGALGLASVAPTRPVSLPTRQATEANRVWRERYLDDLSRQADTEMGAR